MNRIHSILISLMLLLLPAAVLHAQLDPRLQGTKSDFLDLYQQSTSTKVKPEILTIFDFSGSMQNVMNHRLFLSGGGDAGYDNYMTFSLESSSASYRVTATSSVDSAVYAYIDIAADGTMTSFNSGSHTWSSGTKWVKTSISDITISPVQATYPAGTNLTLTATITQTSKGSNISSHLGTGITWSTSASESGSGNSFSCKVPAPSAPVTATIAANTVGTLTSHIFIKPDGTEVTSADAAAASGSQVGVSGGASDIRNWIRAASHVRFSKSVDGRVRTIDLPIPWKIMSRDSTGNPLSSVTVQDRLDKMNADGTTTRYGSDLQIEMDASYAINNGGNLFGTSTTSTSRQIQEFGYNKDYLAWLFNGKYTDGTYAGKYIVYDALDKTDVGGQDNVAWGQGFGTFAAGTTIKVPQYAFDGTYTGEVDAAASSNVLPSVTRVQANKMAAIKTWIQFQADVIWAYRFLDDGDQDGQFTNATDTSFKVTSGDVTTWANGNDSAWTLLNNTAAQGKNSTSGRSVTGMKRLSKLNAGTSTPLTHAMARGLAQFCRPDNIFSTVADTPSECMNHFLILFSDGNDNSTGTLSTTTPYISGTTFSAKIGNSSIISNTDSINQSGSAWNLYTFAGMAAHLTNSSLGDLGTHYLEAPASYTTASGTPKDFLPFSVRKRGSVDFGAKGHRITTMTVGVNMAGSYTSGTSGKRSLFYTALLGDPTMTSWGDIDTLTPFKWDPDENDGNGGKKDGSLYFFDATDPDKLIESLGYAIRSAIGASNINTSASPNTPYIGASLGQEIYIGKFQPPQNGGAIWGGDLMMFGTRVQNNQVLIVDKAGESTTTLDTTTCQWNTKAAMDAKTWSTRTLYTRVPEGTSLTTFSDQDAGYTAIKAYVAQSGSNAATYPVGSDAQKRVIQFVMGGDTVNTAVGTRPTSNRTNIMGDIINSSPTAVEYKWDYINGLTHDAITTTGGNRFRLILVGTNQGWLHAFGEVTWDKVIEDKDGNPKYTIKQGRVAELWAFMPTDFLGYLDQITITNNPHRFMVDGSPVIYHLDLPASSGGSGDGVVNSGERAVAVFGLGKGGRSYYALDVSNPFSPTLRWSLVPDEAASLPEDRIQDSASKPTLTAVKSVVGKMGYSTCTPGIGRITHKNSSGKAILRDAVFLGGGFSRPEIEVATKFGAPLGRSVLALDAYSGNILSVQDFSDLDANSNPKYGPVVKGVVPFEFFINSGMAQRAYFLDYWGGLWAWGSTATDATVASTTYQYRVDSSELTSWGLRRVAQDRNGSALKDASDRDTQQYSEALYTTLPAPFRVGSFTGKPFSSDKAIPAAVGIAMESGDRNNPLDLNYAAGTKPEHHRLTVIFDRQDSEAWGTDANPIIIKDQTSAASATDSGNGRVMNAYAGGSSLQYGDAVISPGNDAYYLAPMSGTGESRTMDTGKTKFGYYRRFPDIKTGTTYLPKGINTPAVVSGSLFYSFFTPTSVNVCTGGSGETASNLICDVLNPIVDDSRTGLSCDSGTKYTWYGTASDYIPFGTRGVIQIGTVSSTSSEGKVTTSLASQTITGQAKAQYPKPRVWRTVH